MDIKERVGKLKNRIEEITSKNRRLLLTIVFAILAVVILLEVIFILVDIKNNSTAYLVVGFTGLTLILIPIMIILTKNSRQVKNLYIQEVIEVYNDRNDLNLEFSGTKKVSKEFNQEMGLFVKFASVQANYLIDGSLTSDYKYQLLNCQLVTSNGKSTTVHFSGLYFMFKIPTDDFFQIRSRYKPKLSGTKFKQIERYQEKVFVPENDVRDYIEDKYLQYYRTINRSIPNKALYIASNRKEIHVAITPKEKFKNIKDLNVETFEKYYTRYITIFNQVIDEFKNKVMIY